MVCFNFYQLSGKLEEQALSVYEAAHHGTIRCSRNAVLLAFTPEVPPNTERLFGCQRVKMIKKELDESNVDYNGTTTCKNHPDCPDKKRTPDFDFEIDNVLSKSIISIARS